MIDATAAHDPPQVLDRATLYVVATPIGNLSDISARAIETLSRAGHIAAEDTRVTKRLLDHYGVRARLIAVHEHNEQRAAGEILTILATGANVALVSDAGTPAVSDPGARLVAAARSAGFSVMPLPGASSVTTALSAAGISGDSGFVFAGFLPSKSGERDQAVAALLHEVKAVVIMEAPHRIEALAQAFTPLGSRPVTICRELTKQFEEIATVAADQLAAWLAAGAQRTRGEFVLVLHPMPTAAPKEDGQRVLQLLLAELPLKTAVKLAAEITGAPRNDLYEAALKLKNQ